METVRRLPRFTTIKIWALAALLLLGTALRAGLLVAGRPFWMDERFSAALAAQPIPKLLKFCRSDVHPPLYYLALWAWNRAGVAALGGGTPEGELIAYQLPGMGKTGEFVFRAKNGDQRTVSGVYPQDWPHWRLAPLGFLRLMSLGCAMAMAAMLWALGRRLWPAEPAVAFLALCMALFSPFMLTWDTVIRSYSMQGALLMGCVLAAIVYGEKRDPKLGAGVVAVLTSAALLTGYFALLALPFIAASIWAKARSKSRALWLLGGLAAGAAVAAALWGGAFLAQNAYREPVSPEEDARALGRLLGQLNQLGGVLWRTLFSYGVTGHLDPFSAPYLYYPVYAIYAASLGFALYGLTRKAASPEALCLMLAVGPLALIVVANTVRPGAVPLQARYCYPVAPFYFLFLSSGLLSLGRALRQPFRRRGAAERFGAAPRK